MISEKRNYGISYVSNAGRRPHSALSGVGAVVRCMVSVCKTAMVIQQQENEKQRQEMEKMTRRGEVRRSLESITVNVTAGVRMSARLNVCQTPTTRVRGHHRSLEAGISAISGRCYLVHKPW